ncbi:MAG: hypothetical protein ACXVEF_09475 [Polyangiales bacterium]
MSILGLSLVPCLRRGWFAVCALASIGALQASGDAIDVRRTDTAPWVALGIRGGAEIPITGPLAMGLVVDLVSPIVRTTFRLDGADAWSTPSVAGAAGLRLAVHFE